MTDTEKPITADDIKSQFDQGSFKEDLSIERQVQLAIEGFHLHDIEGNPFTEKQKKEMLALIRTGMSADELRDKIVSKHFGKKRIDVK